MEPTTDNQGFVSIGVEQSRPDAGCLSEDGILCFLGARLDEERLRGVERHLAACAACRELVALAARSGADPSESSADLAALRRVDDGEYVVLRELARGGMGRILLAHGPQGRPVALKVLLSQSAEAKQRFLREMQLTAGLRHPSIITLYESGRWRSGEPFFAMKLIEGPSMREELASLSTPEQRLVLLPRLIAVTDAIAYAHDRGVVHRDLKPSNILLGAFGETVVIDWGLAKERGVADRQPSASLSAADTPNASGLSTKVGTLIGTPAYMSPEQARGEDADERTDVYGLGALLYHVLAGHPPYSGSTREEVLGHVQAGQSPPLEDRFPAVPPDLAAIVRKAMLPEAVHRYPTAKEMAADLRRFAAGQLVSAHAYSYGSLVRRWFRKHRAAVGVAGALLGVGVLLGALSVRRIVDERNRAELQSTIAMAHRDAAEQLVGFLITGFKDHVSDTDRLHLLGGLGEEVARYYRGVESAGTSVEASTLRSRAAMLDTLGIVEFDRRNLAAARALYAQALDLLERAARMQAATPVELVRHGKLWQRMGTLEHVEGNAEPALQAHRRAIELAELSTASGGDELEAGLLAATNWERISSTMQRRKGDLNAAFEAAQAGISRLEQLQTNHPDATRVLQRRALLKQTASDLQLALGRLDDAAASIQQSIDLFASVARQDASNAVVARQYAYAFLYLANLELSRGRLRQALEAQHTMLERYEAIARVDRDNRATQEDIAVGHSLDCHIHRRAMELDEAVAAGMRAVAILRDHSSRNGNKKSRSLLVTALDYQARAQRAGAQRQAARASSREAVTVARALAAEDPGATPWQEHMLTALTGLADAERELRDEAAASAALEEAIPIARLLADGSPDSADARSNLARVWLVRGDVAANAGDLRQAEAAYRSAVESYEWLVQRASGLVDSQVGLARAQLGLASALAAAAPHAAQSLREQASRRLSTLAAAGRLLPEDAALYATATRRGAALGRERKVPSGP